MAPASQLSRKLSKSGGDVRRSEDEHADDRQLLHPAHLQASDDPDGQAQRGQVQDHVEDGVRPRYAAEARALAVVLPVPPVPEERGRLTLQGVGEGKGDADGEVERDEAENRAAEVGRSEDAQVEAENRRAGPGVAEFVADRGDVEALFEEKC